MGSKTFEPVEGNQSSYLHLFSCCMQVCDPVLGGGGGVGLASPPGSSQSADHGYTADVIDTRGGGREGSGIFMH